MIEASTVQLTALRRNVRREVQAQMEPEAMERTRSVNESDLRRELAELVRRAALKQGQILPTVQLAALQSAIIDDVLGYGPIQPLLDDPLVTEVMINGAKEVFVERVRRGAGAARRSALELTEVQFDDDDHVMAMVERILRRVGRRVDESSPAVDARIPEAGFRVHIIIPPLALKGPTVTIRKFAEVYDISRLVEMGALTIDAATFLRAAVAGHANIIVSGGTGSGKTTLLNALADFIGDDERIVTIEDTAELRLRRTHVVPLQTRPVNVEGGGAFTIRDLVVNALRMRPDRLVVGEVRREEALDMLQAMNTGHDGSLTTVHANDPTDVVSRLETMVLLAGHGYPLQAVRQQIQSALHLIVHAARSAEGGRWIESIAELLPIDPSGALPVRFLYRRDASGALVREATPRFVERLNVHHRGAYEAALDRPW